jgi:O-antigen biosynthesis protein
MTTFRERAKRSMPPAVLSTLVALRKKLEPPPWEETVLHGYAPRKDPGDAMRLTLVLPNLAPETLFGGITTGLEIFFECARRLGAQCRIVLDEFNRPMDREAAEKWARRAGVDPKTLEICPRTAENQPIDLRKNDIFFAFNFYVTLNLYRLVDQHHALFGGARRPLVYLIQDYEPGFFSFSSTHLFARSALDLGDDVWGVFNSTQLHDYFRLQGHSYGREYVFEPKLPPALRSYLALGPTAKEKRILVYGRPSIPRNCYRAILRGLRAWTSSHPQFSDWTVVSAGLQHPPEPIGAGRQLQSLGKLPLEDYAALLRTTAVGLSLMASPHPSYPPLEMAHFGAITLTNRYTCKDLSKAHDNIVSLHDIAPQTIADGLAKACERFDSAPQAGWSAGSHMPGYLDEQPYPFLDQLAADLAAVVRDAAVA